MSEPMWTAGNAKSAETTRDLEKAINAAETLKAGLLAITDDTDALRDTIEGSTNLHEAIHATLLSKEEDEILIAGLEVRVGILTERLRRLKARAESKAALIEQAMIIGEALTLTFDIATLSIGKRPRKVVITDEAEIPSAYWKPQPPELDKTKLAEALKANTAVPGAMLNNGGVGLNIRSK